MFLFLKKLKESLNYKFSSEGKVEDSKGIRSSEPVNRRIQWPQEKRTKGQTNIYKALHIKLKINPNK